jgi:hypothetical protein
VPSAPSVPSGPTGDRGRFLFLLTFLAVCVGLGVAIAKLAASPATRTGLSRTQVGGTYTVTFSIKPVPGLKTPFAPFYTWPKGLGPTPTAVRCLAGWNSETPMTTRNWLAGYVGAKAIVSVSAHACWVEVALGPRREFTAASLYTQGRLRPWEGSVITPMDATAEGPDHLARKVSADGEIGA